MDVRQYAQRLATLLVEYQRLRLALFTIINEAQADEDVSLVEYSDVLQPLIDQFR